MSGRLVFKKGCFGVYRVARDGFVVHNTRKDFSEFHTHINNYKAAKEICIAAHCHRIPDSFNIYLLHSLERISSDQDYLNQLTKRIDSLESIKKVEPRD